MQALSQLSYTPIRETAEPLFRKPVNNPIPEKKPD
jgi:hypothetical protein